jgi:sugar lactone lactonase YvrE
LLAQTITFGAIPNQVLNTSAGVTLKPSASSGLPVTVTSTTPAVCAVDWALASQAELLAVGTCTIQVSQAGGSDGWGESYAEAPTVTQSFTVEYANTLATNFGTLNIGSAGAAIGMSLTFNSSATLGSVSVLTQGATGLDFSNAGAGTCAAGSSYNAGDRCTVNVTFTPTLAGTRYGAVVLADGSGNMIATGYMLGTGVGPQVNFLPGVESTVSTSVLASPAGVAEDGKGNIYITDSGNNRVLKETFSAGIYTESTVSTSALSWPSGVAVDGSGSLYILDSGNNRILKETPSANSNTESTVPTSATNPQGIAVDGSGNVYIVDFYGVFVESLSAGGYTESLVPTSSVGSISIAVDGSSNVYIGNAYSVLKETISAGSYTESTVTTSVYNAS